MGSIREKTRPRKEGILILCTRTLREGTVDEMDQGITLLNVPFQFKDENPELAEEEVITKLFVDWRDNADKA